MSDNGKSIYAVILWIPAAVEADYVQWLDGRHIAEVAAEPGFLRGRRVRLNQTDADGRQGYLVLYDVASGRDLDAYLKGDNRQRFIAYGARFEGVRIERLDGTVEFTV
ncbi:MAG: DUF4286 family protein [Sphingomonadales bacterium]|nr:DUF4286 family protein [Sphingomonadales bacterium]